MGEAIMKIIGHIHSDLPYKFGIPRQSGLAKSLESTIVFEPEYKNQEAFRGLEEFSHLWLIWQFSESVRDEWSPTVRPPRLGGNKRVGVFASRSPFRPNPIGLSSVKLDSIEINKKLGPILHISGADLMDKTPIYDIKPYLPYVDSHPEAFGGFSEGVKNYAVKVNIPDKWIPLIPEEKREGLMEVLAQDPRPSYQNDKNRIYGLSFAGLNIKFTVEDDQLLVCQITKY
ncbi:MAG: tRNA (N6-threonylcarbamoyladenosine(37)-N6)-methyltransferase TrmO [Anaerovoracaceae bacterium]